MRGLLEDNRLARGLGIPDDDVDLINLTQIFPDHHPSLLPTLGIKETTHSNTAKTSNKCFNLSHPRNRYPARTLLQLQDMIQTPAPLKPSAQPKTPPSSLP